MKKTPLSVGLMVFGLCGVQLGAANGWTLMNWVGGLATVGGFIWFCILWDKISVDLRKIRTYDKRVRRMEDNHKDSEYIRDLHDKSVDNKIEKLEKKSSQNIKGIYRNGGEVIKFEKRREA